MNRKNKTYPYLLHCCTAVLLLAAATFLTSCIDEDLSGCGKDYHVNYRFLIDTDLRNVLSEKLDKEKEKPIRQKLQEALSGVFTDIAHDASLNFYRDGSLTYSENHPVHTNPAAFTVYLPEADYQHIAVANSQAETQVNTAGKNRAETFCLQQTAADTAGTHTHALFAAQLPLHAELSDTPYEVNLTMKNSSFAVVIDNRGIIPEKMVAYAAGFAHSYTPADGTYTFDRPYVVRSPLLAAADYYAFYATVFPSHTASLPQARQQTGEQQPDLWKIEIYVTKDGKCCKSTLTVSDPLTPGELHIIKAHLREDGSIATTQNDVGVSIELDWKPGGDHNVEI